MMCTRMGVVLAVVLTAVAGAFAGTLRVGQAEVNGNTVTVPIVLDGDASQGVAALNFRLNYDPAVFTPTGVASGPAASAANKQVQANMVEAGQYVVIMMGMNQNTLTAGEVARITLQRVGEAQTGQSNLSITKTAFSSPAGTEVPSEGSSGAIDLGSQQDNQNPPPDDSTEEDQQTPTNPPPTDQGADDTHSRTSPDTTPASNPASAPTTAIPIETKTQPTQAAPLGGVEVPIAATQPTTVPADLSKLAAATNTADQVRASILTHAPAASPTTAGEPAPATPSAEVPQPRLAEPAPSRPSEFAKASETANAQTSQPTGSVAVEPAQSNASARTAVASAVPAGQHPSGTQVPGGAAAPDAAQVTQKSSGLKIILILGMVGLLVVLFLVRRRLFT